MFSVFLSFFRPFNCWTLCMRSFSLVVCSIHTLPICLRYLFLLPHFFKITFCYFQSFFFILHFFLVVLVLVSFKTHHLDKKKRKKKQLFFSDQQLKCTVTCVVSETNEQRNPEEVQKAAVAAFPQRVQDSLYFVIAPSPFSLSATHPWNLWPSTWAHVFLRLTLFSIQGMPYRLCWTGQGLQ